MFGETCYRPSQDYSAVPLEEQLTAVSKAVEAGKVRAVGLSNETPWGLMHCCHLGESDPASLQGLCFCVRLLKHGLNALQPLLSLLSEQRLDMVWAPPILTQQPCRSAGADKPPQDRFRSERVQVGHSSSLHHPCCCDHPL